MGYRRRKASRQAQISGKGTIITGTKSSGFHSRFLAPVGKRERKSLKLLSLEGRHWQPHQKSTLCTYPNQYALHKYVLECSDWPMRYAALLFKRQKIHVVG
jgi:hypothetical protein